MEKNTKINTRTGNRKERIFFLFVNDAKNREIENEKIKWQCENGEGNEKNTRNFNLEGQTGQSSCQNIEMKE